jgi:uncharacterized protein YceK
VKLALLASFAMVLSGCSNVLDLIEGNTAADIAAKCGVSEAAAKQAKQQASAGRPYAGPKLGKCYLMADDGHHVTAVLDEPVKATK